MGVPVTMPTYGDLRQWESAPVEGSAGAARGMTNVLVSLADELFAITVPRDWRGSAAASSRTSSEQISDHLDDLVAEMAAVRRGLHLAADALVGLERGVAEVESLAHHWQFRLGDDGSVTDVSGPVYLDPDKADEYRAERQRQCDELVDRIEQLMRRADAIDHELGQVLSAALSGSYTVSADGDLGEAAAAGELAVGTTLLPTVQGGRPGDAAGWWDALSDADRARVIAEHPDWIGNLDGIPFAARHEANVSLIAHTRQQLVAEQSRLEADLADNWFGGTFTTDDAALEMVRDKLASLDAVERTLAQSRPPAPDGRMLLMLDMSHDRAMSAISVGDPDRADHVSVFTPGLGSTVHGSMEGYDGEVAGVRRSAVNELQRIGRGSETVASITWVGYQAPQNRDGFWEKLYDFGQSEDTVFDATSAQRGAIRLVSFYNGIDASRVTDPHLTGLGHSYGSTTQAFALQQSTGVDDAVFFGSPGFGTSNSDDIHVSGGRYLIEAKWDPIADVGHFGVDPSHLNKITHISSGETTLPDGRYLEEVTGHSAYLKSGSTSQYNIAVVVAGAPEMLVTGDNSGFGDIISWPLPVAHN